MSRIRRGKGKKKDTLCKRQAPPKGIFVMFFISRRAELPRDYEIRWAVCPTCPVGHCSAFHLHPACLGPPTAAVPPPHSSPRFKSMAASLRDCTALWRARWSRMRVQRALGLHCHARLLKTQARWSRMKVQRAVEPHGSATRPGAASLCETPQRPRRSRSANTSYTSSRKVGPHWPCALPFQPSLLRYGAPGRTARVMAGGLAGRWVVRG